jgi:hypothetical protein
LNGHLGDVTHSAAQGVAVRKRRALAPKSFLCCVALLRSIAFTLVSRHAIAAE